MSFYRNNNRRFTPPPAVTPDEVFLAVAAALAAIARGVEWLSAAAAADSGRTPTGRAIAEAIREGRFTIADVTGEMGARAVEIIARAAGMKARSDFDFSLRDVATIYTTGTPKRIVGGVSIAAYLAYWAAKNDAREAARPAPESGFAGILALFAGAAARLKFPKVTFVALPGIGTLKLQRAASGRNAGGINLTDGRPFGENRFFGAITPTGEFRPGRDVPEALREFLARLASDPATVAGEYGKGSGNCCFCCKDLTDDRSVAVGYGPVCAGHYGLPWGEAQ